MGQFGKIIGVGAVCLGLAAGCGEENANAQNPGAAQVPEEVSMALQGCAGSPEAHKYFLDQAVADAEKNTAVVLKAACEQFNVLKVDFDGISTTSEIAEMALNDARRKKRIAAKEAEIAKIEAERKKQQAELAAVEKEIEENRIKHNRECAKDMQKFDQVLKAVLKESGSDITCGGLLPEN